jgi:hypothetical protein
MICRNKKKKEKRWTPWILGSDNWDPDYWTVVWVPDGKISTAVVDKIVEGTTNMHICCLPLSSSPQSLLSSLQLRPSRSFPATQVRTCRLSCFACFACFHAHSSTVIIRDVSVFLCFASCVFRERGLSGATAAACKCFCNLVDFYVLRTHRSFGTTPSSLSAWMWESSQLSLLEIPLRINVKRENSFVSPQ